MHMSDANKIFELYVEAKQEPQMHEDEKGNKIWTLHGKYHREGAPAIEYADGTKEWRIKGKLHREGAPAIEYADGNKVWYKHGMFHRIGGPAVEYYDGTKYWYVNGKEHRLDGPAIDFSNGTKMWYINGKEYNDVAAWAKAVLEYQGKPASPDDVDAKVAQVMQQDLFS